MAKVTGPLFSLEAKGSFGKGAITFASHISRNQARYTPSWPRTRTPAQIAIQGVFQIAQRYWNWLPDYARWLWDNCVISQHYANLNSPWRAAIKGRLLFFQRAIPRILKGKRPLMTPYEDGHARIFWDHEPNIYLHL
jgi:hypothetical protein